MTEHELRVAIRQAALAEPSLIELQCAALDGLSTNEAVEVFTRFAFDAGTPGSVPVQADEERAVEIFRKECSDLLD